MTKALFIAVLLVVMSGITYRVGYLYGVHHQSRPHIGGVTLEWRKHVGWFLLDDGKSKQCASRVPDDDDAVIIVLSAEQEWGCDIAQYTGLKIPYIKGLPSVTPIIPGAADASKHHNWCQVDGVWIRAGVDGCRIQDAPK